jgi:hypothetical protein
MAVPVTAVGALTGCATSRQPVFQPAPSPSSEQAFVLVEPSVLWSNPDLARYAATVRRHAAEAGIDAQLLMAILYNESYKPHDPAFERAWQKRDPDAAFGIANMHQAAFDDTKRGRPFQNRRWDELPDDPDLALQAAAWYLHDLTTTLAATLGMAPGTTAPTIRGRNVVDVLAVGYNAGPFTMITYARGGGTGADVADYLNRLHANWDRAAAALH